MTEDQLIDCIYEAAAIPSRWKDVLGALTSTTACTDGVFFATSGTGIIGWIATDHAAPIMEEYVRGQWYAKNPQIHTAERIRIISEPRFVGDLDVMTWDEIHASEYYQEFMRPRGVFWSSGSSVTGPTSDAMKFSVHRRYEDGPLDLDRIQRLTQLRPHLARAAFVATRLKLEEARASVAALEAVGLPSAALTRSGRIVAANKAFDDASNAILIAGRERLAFRNAEVEALWNEHRQGVAHRRGATFPIPASEEHPAAIVQIVPIAGAGQDVFASAELLMVVTPVSSSRDVDPKILEGLFDLTPSEARVARGILQGKSLQEIASAFGLSQETIRSQLKSTFQKTATHRQPELVSLLSSVAIPKTSEPER